MSAKKDDKYIKNRKRLYKVLGKAVEFSAKKGSVSRTSGRSVCLVGVRYKGKVIADHLWINNTAGIKQFKKGTIVYFTATASTYHDKDENRKIGLKFCHQFHKKHKGIDKYLHDKKHAQARAR